ncbi:MAG: FAD-dependent oxidoreductase [Rhizobiales bacterium]|nr:FAD-dependent oxidoreductase [Hyphomicrobiales bacterium]
MKLASYWLETAPAFAGGAQGEPPSRADVVVIGGGFTGLSAALALAKTGADVVVLEAAGVVSAASGRNGGHCNNGLAHDASALVDRFGLERTRALYRAFDDGVERVAAIVGEEGIDCDFRRSGKLKLAAKPGHAGGLERLQAFLAREIDPDTAFLMRSDLEAEIGSRVYHGGLLYRRSAMLHVGRFGVGLAEAASRRGARIYENTPVSQVRRDGARMIVEAGKARISCGAVLLATGAQTTRPFDYFRRRIVQVGSFIVATAPLSDALAREIAPGNRTFVTTKHIGNYFRLTADNRLVFGGRARFAISNPTSDASSGVILERAMRAIFPQLRDTRIDYCWGGLLDMTADRLPRAGEREGIHFAMGYSGHGVQMSVYMGEAMARVMAGDPAANPWRDLAWPAVPGHLGKPWFLPLVGAWYRMRDLYE